MAFHPSEDITTGSRLENAIRNYIRYNIGEFLKIDFLDFIQLPTDYISTIYDVLEPLIEKKTEHERKVEGVLKALEKDKSK